MISFTPWYIILGQFGIAVVLALLAQTLRRSSCGRLLVQASSAEFRSLLATSQSF
jgi:hypothetical protein